MKSYISINSKTLGKLLKRYKFIINEKQEIIKAAQNKSKTFSSSKRLAIKIDFKESITNKNK